MQKRLAKGGLRSLEVIYIITYIREEEHSDVYYCRIYGFITVYFNPIVNRGRYLSWRGEGDFGTSHFRIWAGPFRHYSKKSKFIFVLSF